jgi:CRISPR type I-E-associated protein CasB/Cse2
MVAALMRRWDRHPPDRALLGRLRRGVGRRFGEDDDATSALFEVLPAPDGEPYRAAMLEDAHLVATMFALHPTRSEARPPRSLGATLRAVVDERSEAENAARRHLGLVLAADRDDLRWRLRSAVTLAKAHGVAINYFALWRDIRGWRREDRLIQRRWARDFHNVPSRAAEAEATRQESEK